MKLKHLQALRAVAESGSIQEASRRLCLTQPAVSRTIRELEADLGIPLLIRTARGITLTEHAGQVVKRACAITREFDRIYEDVEAMRGELSGRLSIALTAPTASTALMETIADFARARPGVDLKIVELRTAQIEDGLRDGSIDVGLVTHFSAVNSFPYSAERVIQTDMMLTVGGHHRGPDTYTLDALAELPWLTFDLMQDDNSFVTSLFSAHDRPLPKRIIRCASTMLYLGLARRLEAVAIWAASGAPLLQKYFDDGTLQRVRIAEAMPQMSIRIASPDLDLMTAPSRDFAVWLRSRIESDWLLFQPESVIDIGA